MTNKQLLFCKLYTGSESFGNAFKSYLVAYGIDEACKNKCEGARRSASRLLSNVDIIQECNRLLQESCSKSTADMELGYLIRQRKDLAVKVSAIKLYNQLNERLRSRETVFEGGVIFI